MLTRMSLYITLIVNKGGLVWFGFVRIRKSLFLLWLERENLMQQALGYAVLYVGFSFGIFTLVGIMRLYAECEDGIKPKIEEILEKL